MTNMNMERGPQLKPCPFCGGTADYFDMEDNGRRFYAQCTRCGAMTLSETWASRAGEAWNRRNTEGARVVTLAELLDSQFDQEDDAGYCAAWVENNGGGLYSVRFRLIIDLGETRVFPDGVADGEWSPARIAQEGYEWRLWDRKPTREQRRATPWDGPAWREARGWRAKHETAPKTAE